MGTGYAFYGSSNAELTMWHKKIGKFSVYTDFSKDYRLTTKIGEGSFSIVYEAYKSRGFKRVAVKNVSKELLLRNDVFADAFLHEIDTLRSVTHRNVVKLYRVYETEENVSLIFEYFHGGDLKERVKTHRPFSERTAFTVLQQVLEGVQFLHDQHIIHRDLKPENIFIQNRRAKPGLEVKIADFGLAINISNGALPDLKCGTPGYMAPEVVLGKPYNEKVDIYSCGVLLFFMLSGETPFKGTNKEAIMEASLNNEIRFLSQKWKSISEPTKTLILSMMNKDPNKRPSAEELLANSLLGSSIDNFKVIVKPSYPLHKHDSIEFNPSMNNSSWSSEELKTMKTKQPNQGKSKFNATNTSDGIDTALVGSPAVIKRLANNSGTASSSFAEYGIPQSYFLGVCQKQEAYKASPFGKTADQEDNDIDEDDNSAKHNIETYVRKYSMQEYIFRIKK